MAWLYLIVAGLMEVGWPVGLKMAQQPENRILGIVIAVAFMAASGWFLWLAQCTIPIGTSYAIWTSIGAVGTFLVGIWCYGDSATLGKYFGMLLVISGVVVLKLSH